MKNLLNYKPMYFVVHLFLGILLQFYYKIWFYGFTSLTILLISLIIFLFLLRNKKTYFTLCSLIMFTVIGILSVYIQNPKNYSNYYANYFNDDSTAILNISKVLKSTDYYDKYIADVIQIDENFTKGKILIKVQRDNTVEKLKINHQLLLKPKFKILDATLNPHQFNYKFYLEKQYIHYQISTCNTKFLILKNNKNTIKSFTADLKNKIKFSLEKYPFTKKELAIINALLLGQKQDISKDTLNDYTKAGAIHILAISGLHIGILLLILSWIFHPLKKLKHGAILKTVLLLFSLWLFALLTGLSASVVRAVTMFTFITIGNSFKKQKNTEHALITSMFFILLVKPLFIFDIGFQLSYIAVFSIIWLQPLLYQIWKPKLKITHKFWQLITVSLAAQMGILPISLYYFHQFPSLFLVSNIVIIPFLGIILIGGIMCIVLALTNSLPNFIVISYNYCIKLMNSFIEWVAIQDDFLFTKISMSFLMMIAIYILMIFSLRLVLLKKTKYFIYLLLSTILIQCISLYERQQYENKHQFILFHINKSSLTGIRTEKEFSLLNKNKLIEFEENIINSFTIGEHVSLYKGDKKHHIIPFKNETILFIDSLGIYNVKGLKQPIIILQNSPRINLNRLIQKLKPKQIIADGSNYKSYINLWKKSCKKEKTPFYYTGKNGAYIIE